MQAAIRRPEPDYATLNELYDPHHELVSRMSELEGGGHRGARGFHAFLLASEETLPWESTVGVVEGTKLSDAAGQALEEIRKVSRELAELIGSISAQTQKQSASVSDVTRGMQGILKITEETTEGTKQTNVSIGQLTKLAAELRSSVAGFKV